MHLYLSLTIGVFKTLLATILFLSGAVSIVFAQIVGLLLSTTNPEFRHAYLANTKQHFIVLLTSVLTFVSTSPINIRVVSPDLARSKLVQGDALKLLLAPNSVMISNHQIYIEWAFLWWLAHSAGLSGFIYIMLKDSLRSIPLMGYGMSNYEFIFLSRKWAKDKKTLDEHLGRIDANGRGMGPASGVKQVTDIDTWPDGRRPDRTWPYCLIMFPEGTNLSANTRAKTEAYAAKAGKRAFKHVLIPRNTGLRYSLLKLENSVQKIYDVTIAYSGIKKEEYGQDIYSLEKIFLEGKNPQNVEFYIREFNLNDIPIGEIEYTDKDEEEKAVKKFEDWLLGIWQEKDDLLERFYTTGSFVDKDESVDVSIVDSKFSVSVIELLKVFAVPVTVFFLIRLAYTALQRFI